MVLLVAAIEGSRGSEVLTQETELLGVPSFFPGVTMSSMLVIDGSACLARLFAEIFEKRGWNVATCCDHKAAISRLSGRDAYDVVLLSCQVAGTTGLQLLSLIRSFEHRKMTAVIMLTRGDEITDEALAAGADEVLVKPINPNALIWVVEKLVY